MLIVKALPAGRARLRLRIEAPPASQSSGMRAIDPPRRSVSRASASEAPRGHGRHVPTHAFRRRPALPRSGRADYCLAPAAAGSSSSSSQPYPLKMFSTVVSETSRHQRWRAATYPPRGSPRLVLALLVEASQPAPQFVLYSPFSEAWAMRWSARPWCVTHHTDNQGCHWCSHIRVPARDRAVRSRERLGGLHSCSYAGLAEHAHRRDAHSSLQAVLARLRPPDRRGQGAGGAAPQPMRKAIWYAAIDATGCREGSDHAAVGSDLGTPTPDDLGTRVRPPLASCAGYSSSTTARA